MVVPMPAFACLPAFFPMPTLPMPEENETGICPLCPCPNSHARHARGHKRAKPKTIFVQFWSMFSQCLVNLDQFWSFLEKIFWSFLAICGHLWPFVAMFGHVWPCLVIFGRFGSFLVIFGHFWSFW